MDDSYASSHPSPTKKRRLSPPPSSSSSLPQLALQHPLTPSDPLRPIPIPLALLALAASLRSKARALLPSLSKRPHPSSHSSNARYAYAFAAYSQACAGAVTALRAAGEFCRGEGAGEYRGGRVELRVQAMRAELLVEMYEGNEAAMRKVAGEAEEALATAHPSLAPYLPPLQLLQLRLSLATHKPLKHTRQLLRRLTSSLPSPSPSTSPAQAAATYAAHFFAASLPHADIPPAERMASWRTLADAADARGDNEVGALARLAELRTAVEHAGPGTGEGWGRCVELVAPLDPVFGGEHPGAGTGEREAQVFFRLLKVLVSAQTGDVKGAKEGLKATHKLLDAPPGGAGTLAGEAGLVKATITAPPGHPAAHLLFLLPPTSVLYPFTFHLSSALHSDPLGRQPRSLLFGAEGLNTLRLRLHAREALAPSAGLSALRDVRSELEWAARLKSAIGLGVARVRAMRAEFAEAEQELLDAVSTAVSWGQWDGPENSEMREAAALGWGLMRVARAAREGADEGEAERCFEAVVASTAAAVGEKEKKGGAALSPQRLHTRRLALLSLLVLRLSLEGLSKTPAGSPLKHSSASPVAQSAGLGYTAPATLLAELSPSPSSSSSSSSPVSPAAPGDAFSSLALLLSSALFALSPSPSPSSSTTASETSITALKTALSGALALGNVLQANFVRAGVLGVLGVVFQWTRDREAHKMLSQSYKLAASMGPSSRTLVVPSPLLPPSSSTSSIFPGPAAVPTTGEGEKVQVGNARLQRWAGARLVEAYRLTPSLLGPDRGAAQKQLEEQVRANEACGRWLDAVEKEARGMQEGVKEEGA
ncbi:hypothetical protein JCM8097_000883 [Rhodosporidiobolus ruineniae]